MYVANDELMKTDKVASTNAGVWLEEATMLRFREK